MSKDDDRTMALFGATKSERRELNKLPQEPGALLRQQIALLTLRERRTLSTMACLRRASHGISQLLEEHAHKDARTFGKAAADSEQTSSEQSARRCSALDALMELDAQLNKLNEQKLRAIELLARLEERTGENPGVSFAICIPDNGRSRVAGEGAPPEAEPELALV